ncbi:CCA tRNA nucleotidyltransferase [bacterium]|nr:CCA tRNA nucleotidyltransferase [bacterium]
MKTEDYFASKLSRLSSGKLIISEFDVFLTSRELDTLYKENCNIHFKFIESSTIDHILTSEKLYSKTLEIINNNPLLHKIIEFCLINNIEAYLVGGPLRDIIANKKTNDLDIMIKGDAIKLFKNFSHFKKDVSVKKHTRFNTLKISDYTQTIDIASSRKETYSKHGTLPEVKLTDKIVDDLKRRDFSINAMALSLTGKPGILIDPFSGITDLGKHLINILQPESFLDDPTRILRALKFLIRLKLKLSDSTKKCLQKAMESGAMNKISGFRFHREIILMLKERDSLIDILLLLKNYSIFENFTGFKIDDYNKKIIEIFESDLTCDYDSEILFKAIFLFLYSDQIGTVFMKTHFEKFGFKQKILKKLKSDLGFNETLIFIR